MLCSRLVLFVLGTQKNLFALGFVLKKMLAVAAIASYGCLASGRETKDSGDE